MRYRLQCIRYVGVIWCPIEIKPTLLCVVVLVRDA